MAEKVDPDFNFRGCDDVAPAMDLAPQVKVLARTDSLIELHTVIRDINCTSAEFMFNSSRLIRLLCEEALNLLPYQEVSVTAPTGGVYNGVSFLGRICGVSIMRAGEAMEEALRECCRDVRIGKILIQRDKSGERRVYYAKFPVDMEERYVILMDPLLASGGTVMTAISVLLDAGVQEERIIFISLIAAPLGLQMVTEKYPKVNIVTTWVDECLDEEGYILPGMGDFGDRYFCTDIRIEQ